jgi:hypothetical protein
LRQHKRRSDAGVLRVGSIADRALQYIAQYGPSIARDIAEAIEADEKAVRHALAAYHGTRCYIQSWSRTGEFYGKTKALWAAGQGRDARRPGRLNKTEISRRYRAHQTSRQQRVASVFEWRG